MKDRFDLDEVVLIGRTLPEYCQYFQLDIETLQSERILDVGAGISSFCGEAAARGLDVTAADPIYALPLEHVAQKSELDLNKVLEQFPDTAHKYNWTFYRDTDELCRYRQSARQGFLKDYRFHPDRYVTASLPETRFRDNEFGLVLVSHVLFLYDHLLDYEFHKRSVLELGRIASREVRVYPVTNMSGSRSNYLERLIADPDCSGLTFTTSRGNFAFLKNSEDLLRITRKRT
jgi:hypothetical protein